MAAGRYKIQKDNDWNTIFFRFKQGKQFDIIVSIGIEVPRGRWSDTKQEILATPLIDFKKLNIKLKEFKTFIIKEYETSKLSDDLAIINSKWLKERINIFFVRESKDIEINKKLFFTSFIESFILESRTRKTKKNTSLKPRTIQHYETTLKKIEEFEKYDGKRNGKANDEIINLFCEENGVDAIIENIELKSLPYECIEFMFRNHYDFFGLIEKGLAISYNTL